jgi:prolyl oligopeptidase PreP (S9A serine peptidase family)
LPQFVRFLLTCIDTRRSNDSRFFHTALKTHQAPRTIIRETNRGHAGASETQMEATH